MDYPDLSALLAARPPLLARGPLMIVLAEDRTELASTVAHHLEIGFRAVILLATAAPELPAELRPRVATVRHRAARDGGLAAAVTRIAQAVPMGTWLGYAHNAEYLFFPFCESRTVGEMLAFHMEERRAAMVGVVVDLYAADLGAHPDGVDRETAHFDARGYYALAREEAGDGYAPQDRQVDIYGGLRWRFEEHVPWKRRRIDRVMLFRAFKGIALTEDFTTNDAEMNTVQCRWHHNLTCAMASFRTAKALMQLPGPKRTIRSYRWEGSRRFDWTGQQLLDLGLMEPGQWF